MRPSILQVATLAALFISAFIVNHRAAGSSPIAWFDTFNDEEEVQHCLTSNSCTAMGVGTSIHGQVHAVAWLELRTLLAWLGLGFDGAHLVLQILNATAAVLIFCLATRLGGPLAGAAAVWIATVGVGATEIRFTALYNTIPLPFLGAVFVLACTAAVERPGVVSLGLSALVGAVMANVHLACVLTGASVLWVALLAPRRRFFLTVFAALLFAAATLVVAPPCWLNDLASLLHHQGSGGSTGVRRLQGAEFLRWGAFAVGAWLASLFGRAPALMEYRHRSQGALAVLVPFLAAFVVAPYFGLDAGAKYLAHVRAACAIAAALPLALVAEAALQPQSRRRLRLLLDRAVPIVLASLMVVLKPQAGTADEEGPPTMADLTAVASTLRHERGWNLTTTFERLKAPHGMVVLTGLRYLGGATDADAASPVSEDSETSALLISLRADELPQPLPSNWKIVRRSRRMAVVLVHTQSRIDWSAFTACVRPANDPARVCAETGFRFAGAESHFGLPGMPTAVMRSRDTLTLRLHVRPAGSNFTDEVFLPRLPDVCGGRIASDSEGALHVAADRRHATLSPGQPSPSTIELEWDILSPECDGTAYDGLPPFFVEADTADAELLEAILRKREG